MKSLLRLFLMSQRLYRIFEYISSNYERWNIIRTIFCFTHSPVLFKRRPKKGFFYVSLSLLVKFSLIIGNCIRTDTNRKVAWCLSVKRVWTISKNYCKIDWQWNIDDDKLIINIYIIIIMNDQHTHIQEQVNYVDTMVKENTRKRMKKIRICLE